MAALDSLFWLPARVSAPAPAAANWWVWFSAWTVTSLPSLESRGSRTMSPSWARVFCPDTLRPTEPAMASSEPSWVPWLLSSPLPLRAFLILSRYPLRVSGMLTTVSLTWVALAFAASRPLPTSISPLSRVSVTASARLLGMLDVVLLRPSVLSVSACLASSSEDLATPPATPKAPAWPSLWALTSNSSTYQCALVAEFTPAVSSLGRQERLSPISASTSEVSTLTAMPAPTPVSSPLAMAPAADHMPTWCPASTVT